MNSPTTAAAPERGCLQAGATATRVPARRIRMHPRNIRSTIDGLDELAASIRSEGVLEPLVVHRRFVPGPGVQDLELIAGHRRLAAAEIAGLKYVPAIVLPRQPDDVAIFAMIGENTQRRAVPAADLGRAVATLHEDFGYSYSEIADRLGITIVEVEAWLAGKTADPAPAEPLVATPDQRPRLTQKNRTILSLVANGLSNQQIAARMSLSEQTVKTHMRRIMEKLDATSRGHAALIAHELGLLLPPALLPAAPAEHRPTAPPPPRKGPPRPVKRVEIHSLCERWNGRAPDELLTELRSLLGGWEPAAAAKRDDSDGGVS